VTSFRTSKQIRAVGEGGGGGAYTVQSALCRSPLFLSPPGVAFVPILEALQRKYTQKEIPTACFVSGVERVKVKEATLAPVPVRRLPFLLSSGLFFSQGER
jgi:hypothetical protein